MAMIQVKAKALGYYDNKRQREGTVFHMDEAHMLKDKNGKPILPKWVVAVSKKQIDAEPVEDKKSKVFKTDDEVI